RRNDPGFLPRIGILQHEPISRRQIMRRVSILMLIFCICFALAAWPQVQPLAKHGKIIEFDAPGAGPGPGQGTQANDINPERAITGWYIDASGVYHGFLRSPDGAVTTFDAPGAGTGAGQGTGAWMVNPSGEITGWYANAGSVYNGFVRSPDGTITTFHPRGAGRGANQGGGGFDINPKGEVAGNYVENSNALRSFLRYPDGTFTIFEAPDAGKGSYQGTYVNEPGGLNSAGAVTGPYVDANYVWHSYVRAADGTITEFDAPGAGAGAGQGTVAVAIDPAGAID